VEYRSGDALVSRDEERFGEFEEEEVEDCDGEGSGEIEEEKVSRSERDWELDFDSV